MTPERTLTPVEIALLGVMTATIWTGALVDIEWMQRVWLPGLGLVCLGVEKGWLK